MSNLPAGEELTSINGTKGIEIPRSVNGTDPEDIATAITPSAADPSADTTGQLPPGGILMEAPALSREFPSIVSSFITSVPEPEPTETQPNAATSAPPQFRLAPGEDDESEKEVEEDETEDLVVTEALEDLPTETSVSGELLSDEDEVKEDDASKTTQGSTEGTESPEDSAEDEGDEEDDGSSIPTSAQDTGGDNVTQTAGSPESTDDVGSGAGRTGNDDEDSEETGDIENDDDSRNGSGSGSEDEDGDGGSSNDSDSDGEDSESSRDSDSRNGSDDGSNDGGNDDENEDDEDDEEDEDGFGGAGAVPSGTREDSITTTLEGGVVTTIPAPSGNGQGSPTEDSDTNAMGSASKDAIEAKQAGVIAGSVVGSVAAVALIGFLLFWFWRKRIQRHKYVIQTPVFEPPNSSRTEKTWDFDNGSIGPTNKTARMKEAVEYRFDAIGRKFNKPSPQSSRKSTINTNRGNSQFFAAGALPPRSRDNSDIIPDNDELSNQDRAGNWWSRVREDANFNWGVRNDDSEVLERNGSVRVFDKHTSGGQDFPGALGLMINDAPSRRNDPFSDEYAVNRPSPAAEGYAVHQTPPLRNPFDDANSIQPIALAPTVYEPRGQQRRSVTGSLHRQISSPLRHQSSSPYQRSDTTTPLSRQQTTTPLSRGAVRSDQFDLEIEPHPGTLVAMPEEVTTREGTREGSRRSFTSTVSSLSDWDDGNNKGDVGAAAMRWAEEKSPGIGKAS